MVQIPNADYAALVGERDALSVKVAALQAALSVVMNMEVRGHALQNRLQCAA